MIPPSRPALARTLGYDGGWGRARPVEVPVETAVGLVCGGIPHVVLMATPADLEDLAIGFSLTEGLIAGAEDVRSLALREVAHGIEVALDLSGEAMKRFLSRRRGMSGRTSCGICGVESLDQIAPSRARLAGEPVAPSAIARALAALDAAQHLHRATRAVHAAGWFDRDGRLLTLREDVGRHNALDKMIGACLAQGHDPAQGFAVITSRCSFEMVDKAAAFGAGTLVAISAPTSLAIERAEALGLSLVAIARADAALTFTDPSTFSRTCR